jgi:hypothetical protein
MILELAVAGQAPDIVTFNLDYFRLAALTMSMIFTPRPSVVVPMPSPPCRPWHSTID